MMHLDAKPNEYQQILGPLFDKTPKAVWAALAVAFVDRLGTGIDDLYRQRPGDPNRPDYIRAVMLTEWGILHANGIVPQKPPKAIVML